MKEELIINWLNHRIDEIQTKIEENKKVINAGYKKSKVPVSERQAIVKEQYGELAAFIECRTQLQR